MSNGPSSQAGPSRLHASTSKLQVVQKDTSSTPRISKSTSLRTDASILSQSIAAKEQYQRKSNKYADKLMETTVALPTFRLALKYIKPLQFAEILHERHLNGLCSYPTCSKSPREAYYSGKRFRISTTKRSIREEEGNEREGFCSESCRIKGEWVARELDTKSTGQGVDLLEDMVEASESGNGASGVARDTEGKGADQKLDLKDEPGKVIEPRRAPVDLIPSLVIHERPLDTMTTPIPPSLAPIPKVSINAESNSPQPNSTITSPPLTSRRSAQQSFLQTPSRLTSSILAQSRQMGPVPQLPPDDEDEEDDIPTGAEFGLDWGDDGDEELQKMFEDMRLGLAEIKGEKSLT